MNSAFSYPARRHDRALSAAGQIERLARAALRRLRAGQVGVFPGAFPRLAPRTGAGAAALRIESRPCRKPTRLPPQPIPSEPSTPSIHAGGHRRSAW